MKARSAIIGTGIIIAALGGGGYMAVRAYGPTLELGVGYAARVGCACRYIGNRPLQSCLTDYEPGMEMIALKDDPATRTVTASVPFIATRAARYDPVLGCQPDRFVGTPVTVKR